MNHQEVNESDRKNGILPQFISRLKSLAEKRPGFLRSRRNEHLFGPNSEALLVELGYLPSDWKKKLQEHKAKQRQAKQRRSFLW